MADTDKVSMTELRLNTLACWWPNKITGRHRPAWPEIHNELLYLAEMALERRNDRQEHDNLMRLAQYASTKIRKGV